MLHTHQNTPLLLSLTPKQVQRCTNPVFFNPVLILLRPVQSIQAGFLNHHNKRFFLAWSSLNYFPVQQSAVTNSMYLQSTYTPHLQHIQWQTHLESSRKSAVELYCGNSQRIKAIGCFRRKAPSWMFDRILNATLPNNYLPLHKKLASFPGMFCDILRNVWRHSPECLTSFPGMFDDIPWIITFPPPIPRVPRISFPVLVFLYSPFLYTWPC